MKISDVGRAKGPSGTKRKDKAGRADGSFADHLSVDESDSAPPAGGVTASVVGGVGSLLAAQAVPDSTDGRSRGLARHAEDMLDRLEQLRLDLLRGVVNKDDLAALAHTMRTRKREGGDPRLNEIMDEIELRVEVEIAKLTRGP